MFFGEGSVSSRASVVRAAARTLPALCVWLSATQGCVAPTAHDSEQEVAVQAAALYGNVAVDDTSTTGPISTVGRLSMAFGTGGFGCSGVLVARDAILTAFHCICMPDGTLSTPQSITVSFPQSSAAMPSVVSVHPHPEAICLNTPLGVLETVTNHADLAILRLAAPVPTSVVQQPANILLGDPVAAMESKVITYPAMHVGLGGTDGSDQPPGVGTRRFGEVTKLWLEPPDPCGDILFEGRCDSNWHWEAFMPAGSTHAKGDSGGGLFLTAELGRLELVGIISGILPIEDLAAGSAPMQMWAATSTPDGSTQRFIESVLGGDADADHILDAGDNCPPSVCAERGKPIERCHNPDQTDLDRDGVGEACDNCPASLCGMPEIRGRVDCFNPSQRNSDPDAVGDTCDLCPFTPGPQGTLSPQPDADFDGVGDACDICPKHNPYGPCRTNADCDGDARCRFDGGPVSIGLCTEPPDADDDEIPDGCDECSNFTNQHAVLENSNGIAEQRERATNASVRTLPDECDPVPILAMPEQEWEGAPVPPTLGDGTGPDEKVLIMGHGWIGAETQSGPLVARDQRIQYRHCTCFDGNGAAIEDLQDCIDRQCPSANPLASSAWTTMTVEANPLDPQGIALIPASGSTPQPFRTRNSFDFHRFWRWRADLTAGIARGQGSCAAGDCKTQGVVFARVIREGLPASTRDGSANLRDTFQMYRTPHFRHEPPTAPPRPPVPCLKASCGGWIDPTQVVRDPSVISLVTRVQQPTMVVAQNGRVIAIRGATDAIDITNDVFPSVRDVLSADPATRVWLTPVEAGYRIRRTPGASAVHSVVLPVDLDADLRPTRLLMDAAGLRTDGDEDDGQGLIELEATNGPSSRSGVLGAFSAIDQIVYVVGGVTAEGNTAGSIWRYHTADGSWTHMTRTGSHAPSADVLAVAYDQPRGLLYVLDLDDDVSQVPRVARLVEYDLDAGTSRRLAQWPSFGVIRPYISITDDGRLLLTSAGSLSYTVWRYRITSLGLLLEGVLPGLGRILDQPTMGDRELVLPVNRLDRLHYETLSRNRFLPGLPCVSL